MKKDMAYEFKITARNRVGHGPPYLPEEPIIAGRKKSKLNKLYLIAQFCFINFITSNMPFLKTSDFVNFRRVKK